MPTIVYDEVRNERLIYKGGGRIPLIQPGSVSPMLLVEQDGEGMRQAQGLWLLQGHEKRMMPGDRISWKGVNRIESGVKINVKFKQL